MAVSDGIKEVDPLLYAYMQGGPAYGLPFFTSEPVCGNGPTFQPLLH
jgi:hypothetical protein